MFTLIALASAIFGAFIGWTLFDDVRRHSVATFKDAAMTSLIAFGTLAILITAAKAILS